MTKLTNEQRRMVAAEAIELPCIISKNGIIYISATLDPELDIEWEPYENPNHWKALVQFIAKWIFAQQKAKKPADYYTANPEKTWMRIQARQTEAIAEDDVDTLEEIAWGLVEHD